MATPNKLPRHKSVYLLPNMLTTASLFIGFLGLTWAIKGDYASCALCILSSCIFDGLDGKVVIDVREVRWVRIVLNRRLQVLEGKLVLLLGVPRETALVVELRVLGRLSFKH